MAGLSPKTQGHHHNLTTAVLAHEEKGVAQLTATIERFTNPFSDTHTNLFNLVTKVVENQCKGREGDRSRQDCGASRG